MLRVARSAKAGLFALAVVLCLAGTVYAEPVTIRFYYRGGSEARQNTVMEWISEFERLHPNIKVEWDVAGSGWEQKLIVSMVAGTAPDVTEFWGTFAQELARPGFLLDLRPLIERDFTEEDIADFYPPQWENATVQFGPHTGEQFALPLYTNTTVMLFNETMFEEAGLETPIDLDRKGEWNWETLELLAQKLTHSVDGVTTRWGFQTNWTNWYRVVQYMWEGGGDWFARENPYEFIGHQSEAVQAGSWLQSLIWDLQVAPANFRSGAFASGEVAIADDGLNQIFGFDRTIGEGFKWNLARRAEGPVGRRPVTFDDGLGIWAGSPHPEEAWEFIKFITSKQGQEIMVKHEGLAPVRRSAMQAYLDLKPGVNLNVAVQNMLEAQMVITARTPGSIRDISDTIGYELLVPAFRENAKPYEVLAREVKPRIDAILQADR